jgi:hypothetical protein
MSDHPLSFFSYSHVKVSFPRVIGCSSEWHGLDKAFQVFKLHPRRALQFIGRVSHAPSQFKALFGAQMSPETADQPQQAALDDAILSVDGAH